MRISKALHLGSIHKEVNNLVRVHGHLPQVALNLQMQQKKQPVLAEKQNFKTHPNLTDLVLVST